MTSSSPTPSTSSVYTSAVLLAIFSFTFCLLIIPPMVWHGQNRNLGAAVLVAWVLSLNFQSFLNAIIWSADDTIHWYKGAGLCDIEVKLQAAAAVGLPASLACILRALAEVMDTNRTTLTKTKSQRWRRHAIDVLWSIVLPLLQMPLSYIVQPRKYFILGIAGCTQAVDGSWLSILLVYVPPLIWSIVDAYYATIILLRLYRYRKSITSILSNSSTTRTRFLRLYTLCLVWLIGFVPVEIYFVAYDISKGHLKYNWSTTHNHATWSDVPLVPSHGRIPLDRWVWLISAVVVFVFFGIGRDALKVYKSALVMVGLAGVVRAIEERIDARRRRERERRGSAVTLGSWGRRTKSWLKRRSLAETETGESVVSVGAAGLGYEMKGFEGGEWAEVLRRDMV